MSSAQLDILPPDEAPSQMEAATPFALKEQVAERLAAHRARRTRAAGNAPTPIAPATSAKARSAQIAAAVAERYANSQSYRDFLAAEAERAHAEAQRAIEEARAAEEAIRQAAEHSRAQQQLITDLHAWGTPETHPADQLLFELDQLADEAPTPAPILVPAPIPTPETTPTAQRSLRDPGLH